MRYRVAHIIRSVSSEEGGTIEAARVLAKGMLSYDITSFMVTSDSPTAKFLDSFEFETIPTGPSIGKIGYNRRLGRWLNEHALEYDAAVVHGLWTYSSLAGPRALRQAKRPYVIYPHGMLDPYFRRAKPAKHWIKQAYWLLGQGEALKYAKSVLFTCEDERRLADGAFWGYEYKPKVVSFGTEEPELPDTKYLEKVFRESFPKIGASIYILFIGRLHRKKGVDLLVEAFSRLRDRLQPYHLVIAGPDEQGLRSVLQQRSVELGVDDRIHFLPMIQGHQKWGAFASSDVLALPSHQENFGIVVAESLLMGKPVLISDKVNIWREICNSSAGYVDEDTIDGTERLLLKWMSTAATERKSMSQNARNAYLKHFRSEDASRSLAKIIRQISGTK